MNNGQNSITTDAELDATLERIRHFQSQLVRPRRVETDPEAYRLSAAGFLAEVDRMQAAVSSYLSEPADRLATSA
ncbi:MAG: hypothetical protein ACKOBP_06265 [Planctomycetia bacterium]